LTLIDKNVTIYITGDKKMKKNSGASNEILGVSPSELTGLSVTEIEQLIRRVQSGVQGEKIPESEILNLAQQIFEDVNS
jgi:hypothetical protein